MEKLLWLDGHTSRISTREAMSNTWALAPGIYILYYKGFKFEWHNNMWMQR